MEEANSASISPKVLGHLGSQDRYGFPISTSLFADSGFQALSIYNDLGACAGRSFFMRFPFNQLQPGATHLSPIISGELQNSSRITACEAKQDLC